jgi:UDP-N-acetylglucosamine--N-acetylmuramyl-(pentapeptide) pyrophosphoryl-undecaprenol N-acetylglucosamine transferase
VALQGVNHFAFVLVSGGHGAHRENCFNHGPPPTALAMGGFTSAAPILAANGLGAKTFLHESNTIPGRANRWLARFVDQAFVGFDSAATQLRVRETTVTGTPVRPEFQPGDPAACRVALGLDRCDR